MNTILIVDDEEDLTEVLKELLEEDGYQIFTVQNGIACLEFLKSTRPSLILLDVMLPYLTGYEVLKSIRNDPECNSIPVVMMSASPPKGSQADYHWQEFIRKPFNLECLLKTVANYAKAEKEVA